MYLYPKMFILKWPLYRWVKKYNEKGVAQSIPRKEIVLTTVQKNNFLM